MIHKTEADQARFEVLKTIRAAVRLRHSLNADRELNEILPRAELLFDSAVNRGKLPSPADIKRSVGL